MAKRKMKLHVRMPPYITPRNEWRKLLHECIVSEANVQGVQYLSSDRLQLEIMLYMDAMALSFHDVDNRLKDVMDALQGRMGGSKKVRLFEAIIPNDNQIFKVLIEKSLPPGQSHGFGHLIVSRHRAG